MRVPPGRFSNSFATMLRNFVTNGHRTQSQSGFRRRFFVVLITLCFAMQASPDAWSSDDQAKQQDTSVNGEQKSGSAMPPGRRLTIYQQSIRPLLQQACFDCHSGEDVEGNFRADQLNPDFIEGGNIAWWLEVYSVLSNGEMPPAKSSGLSDSERTRLVDWLSKEIQAAENFRDTSRNHSSFRRLTRYEYNYALQDLLGVPWTFAGDLPAETGEDDAFENNAESLRMSVKQVEMYHQLALSALGRVTVRGDRPPVVHWAIPMKQAFDREKRRYDQSMESVKKKFQDMPEKLAEQTERLERQLQASADRTHYLESSTGQRAEADWNYRKASQAFRSDDTPEPMPERGSHFAVVQPGATQALTVELGDRLPDQGTMRVRIRASRAEGVQTLVPSIQLHVGFQATDQGRSSSRLSQHDVQIKAPLGQPEFYEWNVPLGEIEHRNPYRGEMKLGDQPSPSEYLRFTNSTVENSSAFNESAAILIDFVEVSAPVYDVWPPQSHRDLLGESGISGDETTDAREIISAFMTHAWRRSPTTRELAGKLQLLKRLRPSSKDSQEAIVEVLATILTSPKFLYVLPGDHDVSPSKSPRKNWPLGFLCSCGAVFPIKSCSGSPRQGVSPIKRFSSSKSTECLPIQKRRVLQSTSWSSG